MLSDRPRHREAAVGKVNAVPFGSCRRFSATTEWLAGVALPGSGSRASRAGFAKTAHGRKVHGEEADQTVVDPEEAAETGAVTGRGPCYAGGYERRTNPEWPEGFDDWLCAGGGGTMKWWKWLGVVVLVLVAVAGAAIALCGIAQANKLVGMELLLVILVLVGLPIYSAFMRSMIRPDGSTPPPTAGQSDGTRPTAGLRAFNLPRGSIRGMLALLSVGSFVIVLTLGNPKPEVVSAFGTLTGAIIGFYFGGRSSSSSNPEDK